MYDARSKTTDRSGLIFGVITIAVVAIGFFGVLMMPSGKPGAATGVKLAKADHAVFAVLADPATKSYVAALQAAAPDRARTLEADARKARDTGADTDEVARLVLASIDANLLATTRLDLAKADVRHFDALLSLSESGLAKLSSQNSKWCKGAQYESLATASPQRIQSMVLSEFDYGGEGYDWALRANTILLEAIVDARRNPQNHGALNSRDKQAIQGIALRMMSNPQIMQMMTMQSRDKASQMQLVRNLNFCSLAVTGIDALQALPRDTRGRLWADGLRNMNDSGLDRMMRQMGG